MFKDIGPHKSAFWICLAGDPKEHQASSVFGADLGAGVVVIMVADKPPMILTGRAIKGGKLMMLDPDVEDEKAAASENMLDAITEVAAQLKAVSAQIATAQDHLRSDMRDIVNELGRLAPPR